MSAENYRNLLPADIAHIDFASPEEMERARRLQAIPRYGTIEGMTHRTTVLVHELRVANHAKFFATAFLAFSKDQQGIDLRKVVFYGDHHDDPEIEMAEGDIPTPKKRSATPEERAQMDQDERVAAEKVDRLVSKSLWAKSFPKEFEEYKSQKSLEARIVNFADKWDGLQEAVHEVVCGDNKETFRDVIRGYRQIFEELNQKDQDWLKVIKSFFGQDAFDFPNPQALVSKSPSDLNYKTVWDFMRSIGEGNPRSYFLWLRFNKALFSLDFLSYVFGGWMDKFPQEVLDDVKRVQDKEAFKRTASGLFVPSTMEDPQNKTFGESLENDLLDSTIKAFGKILH